MSQRETNKRLNGLMAKVVTTLVENEASHTEIAVVCAAITGFALAAMPLKARKTSRPLVDKYLDAVTAEKRDAPDL
jgi:hypothetical protein